MTVINFDAPVNFDDPDTNWDGTTLTTPTQPSHVIHANYRERHTGVYRENAAVHAHEE